MKKIKSLAELEQAIKINADFYIAQNKIQRKVNVWELQGMSLGAILMHIQKEEFYYQSIDGY